VPRAHSQAGSDFGNLKPLYPKGCALAIVEVRGGRPWHEERIRTIATLAVLSKQACVILIPVRGPHRTSRSRSIFAGALTDGFQWDFHCVQVDNTGIRVHVLALLDIGKDEHAIVQLLASIVGSALLPALLNVTQMMANEAEIRHLFDLDRPLPS
jgi:hypothetical protein